MPWWVFFHQFSPKSGSSSHWNMNLFVFETRFYCFVFSTMIKRQPLPIRWLSLLLFISIPSSVMKRYLFVNKGQNDHTWSVLKNLVLSTQSTRWSARFNQFHYLLVQFEGSVSITPMRTRHMAPIKKYVKRTCDWNIIRKRTQNKYSVLRWIFAARHRWHFYNLTLFNQWSAIREGIGIQYLAALSRALLFRHRRCWLCRADHKSDILSEQ